MVVWTQHSTFDILKLYGSIIFSYSSRAQFKTRKEALMSTCDQMKENYYWNSYMGPQNFYAAYMIPINCPDSNDSTIPMEKDHDRIQSKSEKEAADGYLWAMRHRKGHRQRRTQIGDHFCVNGSMIPLLRKSKISIWYWKYPFDIVW